ncbi:MAG: DUF2442 domain-containing protein [Planctomycetota bacterium]
MRPTPELTSVEYMEDYKVHVRFIDGVEADVDLADVLWGEVFEPLKDPAEFRRFRLDRALNTITWPCGADLAPEFLYARAKTGSADVPGGS